LWAQQSAESLNLQEFGHPEIKIYSSDEIDTNYEYSSNVLPAPIIRSITSTLSKKPVYHWNLSDTSIDITLPYENNNVEFRLSTPYYLARNPLYHQYFLEGFDDVWSLSQATGLTSVTNLPEGNYVSRVRVLTDSGNTSPVSVFFLRIQPPLKTASYRPQTFVSKKPLTAKEI